MPAYVPPKAVENTRHSRKNSNRPHGSVPGSYQDEEFKTSKDYGAGEHDYYDNMGTEIERLPPIPEGGERLETVRSHKSIQRDTLLEEEIQKINQ